MPLIEFLAFIVFVSSSGLFFNSKFRDNLIAVAIAGSLATVSSWLLIEEIATRMHKKNDHTSNDAVPFVKAPEGDTIFTTEALHYISNMVSNHNCFDVCSDKRFNIVRLILPQPVREDTNFYIVHSNDSDLCGSGGCMSGVLVKRGTKMSVIAESLGLPDAQAMVIANGAAYQALSTSK